MIGTASLGLVEKDTSRKGNLKSMLTVNTTRFGDVEVEESRVVHFPEGLLGFPQAKDYIILEHKPGSPFFWLQAIGVPDLAFVIMDPFLVKKDYLKELPEGDGNFLGGEDGAVGVFALVTVLPVRRGHITVNLLGPLVIDMTTRMGRQVILSKSGYSHRHPLTFP